MANLRAGLIGLGMMGRHHARVLRQLDGVDLVAVADPAGDPHHVAGPPAGSATATRDRKSTRLNSSHVAISYAVFCLKKKNNENNNTKHTEDNQTNNKVTV